MTTKCNAIATLTSLLRPTLLGIFVATCHGGPSTTLGEEPTAVQTIANGTTMCIVKLDLARLTLPDDESLKPLQRVLDDVRQAVGDQTLTIAVDLPYRPTDNVIRVMAKTRDIQQEQLSQWLQRYSAGLFIEQPIAQGEWTTVGVRAQPWREKKESTQISSRVLPVEIEPWQLALADPTDAPLQVAVVPPSYLRRAFEELAPELPAALGRGSSQVLSQGVQWLRLSYDPSTLKGSLLVQSDSAPTAAALAKHVPLMLRGLIDQWGPKTESPQTTLITRAGLLQPQQQSSQLFLLLENTDATHLVFSLLKLTAQSSEARISTNQSSSKLKQLALSIHNYVDAHNCFPPDAAARGEDGRSGLSWRVHILPYIGEIQLYQQFKFDEPWDSPHNIKLLNQMPAAYAPVPMISESTAVQAFHTMYAAPVGEQTICGGEKPVGYQTITDGTSNTVMIVELAPEHAIPWTSPEEYRYDPKNPAAKLYSRDGQTLTAYADGSARSVRIDNTPEEWNSAFTMNGGEIVNMK